MNELEAKAREIARSLTKEQQAALSAGSNYWQSKGLDDHSLAPVFFSDGPSGLRKQSREADYTGLHPSAEAVLYPAACLSACSFDPNLLSEMGTSMGEECLEQGVNVLLAPGINHKRTPWCGRNFEYFSEDPIVSGAMGSAFINGLQSTGVMASLKHFAMNNQENLRMTSNSIADDRTMNELYFPAFKKAVQSAKPASVMLSYNLINGTYACENKGLMDLARDWGFEGMFLTDWGGLNDPAKSFQAGLDLEMPGTSKGTDGIVLENCTERQIEEIAYQNILMMLKAASQKRLTADENSLQRHLDVAKKAAEESMVLLKNKHHTLPLKKDQKIALVGSFAREGRYQGAGSSKVNPVSLSSLEEGLKEEGLDFIYAKGYEAKSGNTDPSMLKEAVNAAKEADVIVAVIGLPEVDESEGYDRTSLQLPQGQLELIERLSNTGKPLAVVLQCGGVVELPFLDKIDALLLMYLGGSKAGIAAARILDGSVNPSGHLAETWIKSIDDVPVEMEKKNVVYKEGIFSGYRYYDTADIEVNFPFGHGLSYSEFAIESLQAKAYDNLLSAEACIRNKSDTAGKAVVQIYIQPLFKGAAKAKHVLAGFKKVFLQPHEEIQIQIDIPYENFSIYSKKDKKMILEKGEYVIEAGLSSRDIHQRQILTLGSSPLEITEEIYSNPANIKDISSQEYLREFNLEKACLKPSNQITPNTTIEELAQRNILYKFIVDRVIAHNKNQQTSAQSKKIIEEVIKGMPVRLLGMNGLSKRQVDGAVKVLNGNLIGGLRDLASNK